MEFQNWFEIIKFYFMEKCQLALTVKIVKILNIQDMNKLAEISNIFFNYF